MYVGQVEEKWLVVYLRALWLGGWKAGLILVIERPRMSTIELLKHNEIPVVDGDAYVKNNPKVRRNIKLKKGVSHLDNDYWAMSKILGHLKSIIINRWNEDQGRY